jgi:menaquinone-specific isochorismate synthase
VSTTTHTPTLVVTTRAMSHEGSLTDWVSAENPLTIQRLGNGLVGLGHAVTLTFRGPDRFAEASAAWTELVRRAHVDNPVGEPGSGLVCFGAFTFSDDSSHDSVLIVPRVVIGRNGSKSWRSDISVDGEKTPSPASLRSKPSRFDSLTWSPGLLGEEDYVQRVSLAIDAVREGVADKVVLARDLVAHAPGIRDWRYALNRLTEAYPDCNTFAVDGLVGSTPETLAVVHGGRLSIRVLAGSTARGDNPLADRTQAHELATSSKDNDEHRYAVNSVVASLEPITAHVVADEQPFTLKLANVWHLATDIEATLPPSVTSLDVVAAVHPSAAVAGSPTAAALAIISRSEPFDRGRYAGPVGWMDASGDGEWSIALRCAQWSPEGTITAYAGAGIVADSDPESELLETRLKFKPVLGAFGQETD